MWLERLVSVPSLVELDALLGVGSIFVLTGQGNCALPQEAVDRFRAAVDVAYFSLAMCE